MSTINFVFFFLSPSVTFLPGVAIVWFQNFAGVLGDFSDGDLSGGFVSGLKLTLHTHVPKISINVDWRAGWRV